MTNFGRGKPLPFGQAYSTLGRLVPELTVADNVALPLLLGKAGRRTGEQSGLFRERGTDAAALSLHDEH
ncbi:hypothetical protein FE391_10345 [Nonomuraea sp. KC401]|uniref:hypothetical protein n=1 Tax=unclassified Nonomuraea TaxID=2593643 RepID=UPI0010FF60F7|nr:MULTISPECIES: hypothetical protein [unclassified Nonomuraea]NBE93282.1 hypothetical protein [Nonomuraea sp. K271]TLF77983.1 hypothetical protein FE391_10345 [Nonomuraea sp. KC401]